MARGTAGTNTQISGTYTSHKGATNFTLAGWVRRSTNTATSHIGWNEVDTHRTLMIDLSGVMYFAVDNGSNSFGSVGNTATGWNHYAMVFNGSQSGNSNRLAGYINGAAQTLSFSGTIPATISSNAGNETFRLGRSVANAVWSTADFADVAWWNASLNGAEISSLSKGFSADKIRPDNLLAYLPLVRQIQDVVSATTLTDQSTTVQPHPRIYA
jgi:hypothetical protein